MRGAERGTAQLERTTKVSRRVFKEVQAEERPSEQIAHVGLDLRMTFEPR